MKVYIVTSGVYSDYQIEGVFSNREAAEKYASIVPDAKAWFDDVIQFWNHLSITQTV